MRATHCLLRAGRALVLKSSASELAPTRGVGNVEKTTPRNVGSNAPSSADPVVVNAREGNLPANGGPDTQLAGDDPLERATCPRVGDAHKQHQADHFDHAVDPEFETHRPHRQDLF